MEMNWVPQVKELVHPPVSSTQVECPCEDYVPAFPADSGRRKCTLQCVLSWAGRRVGNSSMLSTAARDMHTLWALRCCL